MKTRTFGLLAAGCGLLSFLSAALLVAFSVLHRGAFAGGGGADLAILVALTVPFFATMVFLALYVYYDAESRGMPGALWALLIFFFASLPGFLIYLLMRRPRLSLCPACGTTIREDYVVCPRCRASVAAACPSCGRRVEPAWSVCPYCQAALGGGPGKIPATHT